MNAARVASTVRWLGLFVMLAGIVTGPAAGQDQPGASVESGAVQGSGPRAFSIKPSEVAVPEGVAPGQYRRTIVPFQNWTLICDENLKAKTRVCNISQQIVDARGEVAFSWSLAGTAGGAPILILRPPASVGEGAAIRLAFTDKSKPVTVKTQGCDAKVCVAMIPLGPRLKAYIGGGKDVEISFPAAGQGGMTVIRTTFAGLPDALAAI